MSGTDEEECADDEHAAATMRVSRTGQEERRAAGRPCARAGRTTTQQPRSLTLPVPANWVLPTAAAHTVGGEGLTAARRVAERREWRRGAVSAAGGERRLLSARPRARASEVACRVAMASCEAS